MLSSIAGRPIGLERVGDAAFFEWLMASGRVERVARLATALGRAVREGGRPPPCDLARLIGREALTPSEFFLARSAALAAGIDPAMLDEQASQTSHQRTPVHAAS